MRQQIDSMVAEVPQKMLMIGLKKNFDFRFQSSIHFLKGFRFILIFFIFKNKKTF